jgi:Ca2+-binding EF-hand superfamily protein
MQSFAPVEIPLVGRLPSGRPKDAKPVKVITAPTPKIRGLTENQKKRPNDLREYAEKIFPKGIVKPETAAAVAVWEEPSDEYASITALNFADGLLLQKIQQLPEYVRNPERPIVAVISFFLKQEIETIDFTIFTSLFGMLSLTKTGYVTEKVIKGLFARYDVERVGSFSVEEFAYRVFHISNGERGCDLAKAQQGVAKSCVAQMREALSQRAGGFESLHNVARQFSSLDKKQPRGQFADISSEATINRGPKVDEFGSFNREEFVRSITSFYPGYGLVLGDFEMNVLFDVFAKNGRLEFKDFVAYVRGKMTKRRLDLVTKLFSLIDKTGTGKVSLDDVYFAYDGSREPSVLRSIVCAEDVAIRLMNTFDTLTDGMVTFQEFCTGYEWISGTFDSDDYFEVMMHTAWPILNH